MKFHLFIYVIFFTSIVLSCNQKKNEEKDPERIPMIKINNPCSFKQESLVFDTIKFLPLETKDDALIGSMDKIIFKNNTFFIFDRANSSIFLFTDQGKYLSKICKIGEGPGEYINIADFDVDDNLDIYVVSVGSQDIIKYNYPDYSMFTVLKTDQKILEILVDDQSTIWVANAFNNSDGICLGIYSEGKIIPQIENRGIFDKVSVPIKSQSFYRSGNDVFFNPRYSSDVYKISNGKIDKYMQFDFDDFVQQEDMTEDVNSGNIDMNNKCRAYGFKSFYKVKNTILGEIWLSNNVPSCLKYNPNETEGKLYSLLSSKQLKIFTKILGTTPDYLITYINAPVFLGMYDESITKQYDINEESNPILIFLGI